MILIKGGLIKVVAGAVSNPRMNAVSAGYSLRLLFSQAVAGKVDGACVHP